MQQDPIERLIQDADAFAGSPAKPADDMAERVRKRGRRKRTTNMATGSVAVMMVAVAAGVMWQGDAEQASSENSQPVMAKVPVSQEELARLREEIDLLRAQAEAYKQLADRLLFARQQQKKLARLRRTVAGLEALDPIGKQLDRAAFTMMYQADRMRSELNLPASAEENYRRVIDLFGQTRWADVAREKLSEMKASKGDVL